MTHEELVDTIANINELKHLDNPFCIVDGWGNLYLTLREDELETHEDYNNAFGYVSKESEWSIVINPRFTYLHHPYREMLFKALTTYAATPLIYR